MSTPRVIATVFLFALLAYFGGPLVAEVDLTAKPARAEPVTVAGSVANEGFACGPRLTCNPASEYCLVVIGGPKGVPPGHKCVDVSEVTSAPSCETIPDIGVGCECTDSDRGVTVTCTAP